MEAHKEEKFYFEEYIKGENSELYVIWDKKNIRFFYSKKNMTEVQLDRLDLLKTKLNFMFSDEKADFIGIFSVNLTWYKNDWYVLGFNMSGSIPVKHFENTDFIYILNSAIYQKLNEHVM